MRRANLGLLLLAAAAGCTTRVPPPAQGTTPVGEVLPVPPVDTKLLDMKAAVEEAMAYGGLVTTAAAWRGHVAALAEAEPTCPQVWAGTPPEDLVEIDLEDGAGEGLSWVGACATDPEAVTYDGFAWWSASNDGTAGARALVMDATVTDATGAVLFDFDGEASDTLDLSDGLFYASEFSGIVTGPLAGIGGGLRAQNNSEDDGGGGFSASWSDDGSIDLEGAVEVFDGFGPPDARDPALAPELEDVTGWAPGSPRFTSIRFALEFRADCLEEPYGYVGLRGNEGFWFDVYFLPLHDPNADNDGDGQPDGESAQSNAYPYEQIDNVACDGIGTLFARNVDLKAEDEADPAWSREIAPDFAAVRAALPTPTIDEFVFTLRNLPE